MKLTTLRQGLGFSKPSHWLLPIVLALASSCCTTTPTGSVPWVVKVELDPALTGKSVLVDVVGVNPANEDRWKSYSMSKYWKDRDPMRLGAPKWECNFISDSTLVRTLAVSDPVWKSWLPGATTLFVLADLPGAHSDLPGTQDPRRQILPLEKSAWENATKELIVRVKESGIEVVTPLRPRRSK